MASLIEELEAREAAARVRVEVLEAGIAELTVRLEGEREAWSRLRNARETVAEVLAELSAEDAAAAVAVPGVEGPDPGRRQSPGRGWWGRSWCRTGGLGCRWMCCRMCTGTSAPHVVDHPDRDTALTSAQRAAAAHVHQETAMPEEYLEGRTTDTAMWLHTPQVFAMIKSGGSLLTLQT